MHNLNDHQSLILGLFILAGLTVYFLFVLDHVVVPEIRATGNAIQSVSIDVGDPADDNFKCEFQGDYSSPERFVRVKVEGGLKGNACMGAGCGKCGEWYLGLTGRIDPTFYCNDGSIVVGFEDSVNVGGCGSRHRACIYRDGWHCCQTECVGGGCNDYVVFDCIDLSCK
ncbi:hypothetical protein ACFLRF_01655 [Candidatus Altiarchaeota archaeon]